ncbi:MAG: amino acid adenylation domain-containing protein [Armatimonadia bacterium]|nr:amino acid adenylation domain-containing protein [Armatimonadia bacterium]
MSRRSAGLGTGFLRSCDAHADRPAVEVAGRPISYSDLRARACALAATLEDAPEGGDVPLTGVLASRSPTAFAGVLAPLLRGHGYVPLNPAYPSERTRVMLERSGCRSVIVDGPSSTGLSELLPAVSDSLLLVLPDHNDVSELQERWPQHRFLGSCDLKPEGQWSPCEVAEDAVAYLLFTSGSTGSPKGVPVSHRNVRAFLDHVTQRYEITAEDRLSQTFEMTFDLSVFDMFAAWERGACVCCPTRKTLIKPGDYIRKSALTIWFSVPSTGVFMKKLGMLKPGSYPTLRWSLFCGEALAAGVATAWAAAAANSTVENLYGPTEVTLACTAYRWDPARCPAESEADVVPIGEPFPGLSALVVDSEMCAVPPGTEGELLMAGPQVVSGYWLDPGLTQERFVRLPGSEAIWYRTGDRVRRPREGEPLHFIGRMDDQIQIHGHRVELGEVEAALRAAIGEEGVAAVGWPRTEGGAGGIEAFLVQSEIDAVALRRDLAGRLPDYMIPRRFHLLRSLPVNPNGKIDRRALLAILENAR